MEFTNLEWGQMAKYGLGAAAFLLLFARFLMRG
jgi:hypothetical protein